MNKPQAYGTFVKRGSNTFRTSAYLQWGDSDKSIGSALLLNPGSANFHKINPVLKITLDSQGESSGEIKPDPTMEQLVLFLEGIHKEGLPLAGRFHIYNLFNLQNAKSDDAVEQLESLAGTGVYNITESVASVEELQKHPWILLGWGMKQNTQWRNLEQTKRLWMDRISESGIFSFGKKHHRYNDYYHPCPLIPTNRPVMLADLLSIYHRELGNSVNGTL